MWARWTSLCNHIIDVHTEHSAVFNSCGHGPLEGRERHKMWLKPGKKKPNITFSSELINQVSKQSLKQYYVNIHIFRNNDICETSGHSKQQANEKRHSKL